MQKKVSTLRDSYACSGCGACIAACPQNAIEKKKTVLGAWIPEINPSLCVNCNLCEKICKGSPIENTHYEKKAYVAYSKDQNVRQASASGGAFSSLATYVLNSGGSVFGAEIYFEDGRAIVEHNRITQVRELYRLQGSKYVQSDASKAYGEVRKELLLGKMVLFSGCSCQVAGLRKFLGNTDTKKLYTVDLICHGVPSLELLNDYLSFMQKKNVGTIKDLSFRTKKYGDITYEITAHMVDKSGESDIPTKYIKIPMNKSGYYLAFMGQQTYRESCYQCQYASLNKPSDITLGDYFELEKDYPEFFDGNDAINVSGGVSCVITHTPKGQQLLEKAGMCIYLREVSLCRVQSSHLNLQRPSVASFERSILIKGYEKYGYSFIEAYYRIREPIVSKLRIIKRLKNDM